MDGLVYFLFYMNYPFIPQIIQKGHSPTRFLKFHRLPPSQFTLDPFNDRIEMLLLMDKIKVICSDREDRAQVERAQPIVVERIEQGQVFGRNARLHIPGAAADTVHQNVHRRLEVDQ